MYACMCLLMSIGVDAVVKGLETNQKVEFLELKQILASAPSP